MDYFDPLAFRSLLIEVPALLLIIISVKMASAALELAHSRRHARAECWFAVFFMAAAVLISGTLMIRDPGSDEGDICGVTSLGASMTKPMAGGDGYQLSPDCHDRGVRSVEYAVAIGLSGLLIGITICGIEIVSLRSRPENPKRTSTVIVE